ncbi:MAG: hypothetical protein MK089_06315 [Phycisphaerales bacterium]|nr:hypothetical protein [Phycisphaerales bacterium]
MGLMTGFIQASAVLASQAQQVASRIRNRQQATQDDPGTPQEQLRVDGVELSEAIQELPDNRSEQSRQENQRRQPDGRPLGVRKVDLKV